MTQFIIEPTKAELKEIDSAPITSIPREAYNLIADEWKGHIKDMRDHNKHAQIHKSNRLGGLVHKVKSTGFAALYTGYFWFDDFPARGLTKLVDGRPAQMALVGGASLLVGGAVAVARRNQLSKMYDHLSRKVKPIGPTISQMANASVLGAPNTVKATAQSGPSHERRLMTGFAIVASAATYAALQSITTGPVIDAIDRILPGSHFAGEVIATGAFVVGAIYTKSFIEVTYHRFND